jgi:hypothetical protein
LAAWLVGWFVGWLVGWLAGWLTHLFFQDAGGEVPKAGKDIYKGKTYKIPDEVLAMIRAATNSQDIPKEERNKLYAAIGRNIDKPEVPAQVLARWTMDRKCHKTAFLFLKEWAEDTTFASCTVTEEHNRTLASYTRTEFTWITNSTSTRRRTRTTTRAPGLSPTRSWRRPQPSRTQTQLIEMILISNCTRLPRIFPFPNTQNIIPTLFPPHHPPIAEIVSEWLVFVPETIPIPPYPAEIAGSGGWGQWEWVGWGLGGGLGQCAVGCAARADYASGPHL